MRPYSEPVQAPLGPERDFDTEVYVTPFVRNKFFFRKFLTELLERVQPFL